MTIFIWEGGLFMGFSAPHCGVSYQEILENEKWVGQERLYDHASSFLGIPIRKYRYMHILGRKRTVNSLVCV